MLTVLYREVVVWGKKTCPYIAACSSVLLSEVPLSNIAVSV